MNPRGHAPSNKPITNCSSVAGCNVIFNLDILEWKVFKKFSPRKRVLDLENNKPSIRGVKPKVT